MPKSRNNPFGNKFRQLQRYAEGLKLQAGERYWKWASLASEQESQSLLKPEVIEKIRFEEFEKDPMKMVEVIYKDLLKDDYSRVQGPMQDYINSQKGYSKNRYTIKKRHLDRIYAEWGDFMTLWGYELPDNIDVVE